LVLALVVGCGSAAPPGRTNPASSATPGSTVGSSAGSTPAGSPAGPTPPPASGAVSLTMGPDYCYLLTPADLTAAGVGNVGELSTNEYDNNFYCVYGGSSAATGGIELDAFIIDDPTTLDENFGYVDPGTDADDVTASVPGADKARVGSLSSGGPDFGTIAVQSGNLIFGLSIPPVGDWKGQLTSLATLILARAAAVASGQASLPAQAVLPSDLCAWVTADDLQPLANETMNAKGEPQVSGQMYLAGTQGTYLGKQVTCKYGFGTDPNTWSGGLIMDVIHSPNDLALARKVYDEQVTYYADLASGGANSGYEVTPLTDLGDAAQKIKLFNTLDASETSSWVVEATQGPIVVKLDGEFGHDHLVDGTDAALVALAKEVLDRAVAAVGAN
jgi:hypothetical protein